MATTESEPRAGIEGFPALWQRVVTAPHGFFADMPRTGGLGEPTLFLALCAAIDAVGHLILGAGVAGMIASFVGQMIAAFVLAAILVLVAQNVFDGRGGYEPTFRVVAYAWAPLVVAWLPGVGSLALVYAAYLMLRGLERVQAQDTTRAALTLVISLAILWILARAVGHRMRAGRDLDAAGAGSGAPVRDDHEPARRGIAHHLRGGAGHGERRLAGAHHEHSPGMLGQ